MAASEPITAAHEERTAPAVIALLCGVVCIGFGPIIIRVLGRDGGEMGPISVGFWRAFLALPVLLAVALWRRRRSVRTDRPAMTRGRALRLALPGVLLGLDMCAWNLALGSMDVNYAVLVANLTVVFVAMGGWRWLGERLRPLFGIGVACAFVGMVGFLAEKPAGGQQLLKGVLLVLAADVFYAGYLLVTRVVRRTEGVMDTMLWSTTACTVVMFIGAVVMGEDMLADTYAGWGMLVALAWACFALAFALITYALAHLPAAMASAILLGQPVLCTILGVLILKEHITAGRIACGVLVLIGIFLAQRGVLPAVKADRSVQAVE
jgi:drug/metabolite transporter (DMT)-like permease